jgi:hypothetical protein
MTCSRSYVLFGTRPSFSGDPIWWWRVLERRKAGRVEITIRHHTGVQRELHKEITPWKDGL